MIACINLGEKLYIEDSRSNRVATLGEAEPYRDWRNPPVPPLGHESQYRDLCELKFRGPNSRVQIRYRQDSSNFALPVTKVIPPLFLHGTL